MKHLTTAGPVIYSGSEHTEISIPIDQLLTSDGLQIFPEVVNHDIFEFKFGGQGFTFKAGRYVGLIPINSNVTIDVKPRVPLRNLERIFIKSGAEVRSISGFSKWFDPHEESSDSLLDFITDALLSSIKRIAHLGLYKEYQRKESFTAQPKGRIEVTSYRYHAAAGQSGKVKCVWHERTVDNGINRCLLAALEALASKYSRLIKRKGAMSRLRQINIAAHHFQGVTSDRHNSFLRDPMVELPSKIPSLRDYYREAVGLSKAVIYNQGISLSKPGSEFSLSSLIIDMGTVFEGYVRNILLERFDLRGYKVADGNLGQDAGGAARKLFIDDGIPRLGKNANATPDIVIQKEVGVELIPEIVIDAKYKVAAPSAQRSEINQVVTYAVIYGVKKALLIMPYNKETKLGLHYLGLVGAVQVYQYNYDLAAQEVEAEEVLWVRAIAELCQQDSKYKQS